MYGGMGGMGYGGYGGGMGGMYGGMPGMQGDPNDPNSLTHGFTQSTQATFQIIESIVGAFGGFAQMLESTYMATHSSFFGRSCVSANNDIADNCSDGVCCRAIRKLTKYSGVDTRHIHTYAMAADALCKSHRPTTASRCNITYTKCLRQIRRSKDAPRRDTSQPDTAEQETIPILPCSRFRSPILDGKIDQSTRSITRRGGAPVGGFRASPIWTRWTANTAADRSKQARFLPRSIRFYARERRCGARC